MEDSSKSEFLVVPVGDELRETSRLLALDRRIVEIANWLDPARLLNPTLESRQRALESFRVGLRGGGIANPRLEYLPLPEADMRRTVLALDALAFGDTEVDVILADQVDQLRVQLDLLRTRGTAAFGRLAARIYGLPDARLLRTAHSILDRTYDLDQFPTESRFSASDRIDATSMARTMRAELDRMGVHDWSVCIQDEMSARMSVTARHREVRIKSDSLFTAEDERRLIVHELRTHVVRACNGFRSGLLNLGLGLRDYMATEEGLASVMEQRHGLLRRSQVETYAYRALGAALSHEFGFADTFRELIRLGASSGLAWDVAMRVKRGLTDTSMPGGFPKDYVYLQGRELVVDYLRGGGREQDLFLGKISVEHIPVVKHILATWNFAPSAA